MSRIANWQAAKKSAGTAVELVSRLLVAYIFCLGLQRFYELHPDWPYLGRFFFPVLIGLFFALLGYYIIWPFIKGVWDELKRRKDNVG